MIRAQIRTILVRIRMWRLKSEADLVYSVFLLALMMDFGQLQVSGMSVAQENAVCQKL